MFLGSKKIFLKIFLILSYATFQCGRYNVKKSLKNFFLPMKNWKKHSKKLLIIGPNPFITQSSPGQRPTVQNWFSILWNLGTRDLFSYLWYLVYKRVNSKSIDCTKASDETGEAVETTEVNGDYQSPTKVRNVIRQQYKELGPMNFHQAGVLSCFVILILLWFFREPQFMTGWGDFFHTR